MSDLICRKTMRRCDTPSMCAPFQGCGSESPSTAQLEDARHQGYLDGLRDANASIAAEREELSELAAHNLLAALIDIYDDGNNNAPEDRCYVEGAWKETINEARAYLAAPALPQPSFDRDTAEAWMLRAQVSLKQKQFGAAQMEIENALNILRPKE